MTTPSIPFIPKAQELPGVAQVLDLSESLGAARRWISDRHNWVRVAWFGTGVVLIIMGAGLMAGKPALKIVDKVI